MPPPHPTLHAMYTHPQHDVNISMRSATSPGLSHELDPYPDAHADEHPQQPMHPHPYYPHHNPNVSLNSIHSMVSSGHGPHYAYASHNSHNSASYSSVSRSLNANMASRSQSASPAPESHQRHTHNDAHGPARWLVSMCAPLRHRYMNLHPNYDPHDALTPAQSHFSSQPSFHVTHTHEGSPGSDSTVQDLVDQRAQQLPEGGGSGALSSPTGGDTTTQYQQPNEAALTRAEHRKIKLFKQLVCCLCRVCTVVLVVVAYPC